MSTAALDAAPQTLAAGTPAPLRAELEALLGADQVLARASDIIRYASDASPYRLLPKAVVQPRDVEDVVALMGWAHRSGIALTFRAAGTSLNGQSQGDGVLVDVRRHWSGVRIEEGGALVRVRPGTVLGRVNRALAKHGRRLGPDPASTDAATVGGVIANNSGGMRCGVVRDSYRTVRWLKLVLPSGTVVDTGAPDADARLAAAEPQLHAGLLALRDEIRADAALCARIVQKFEIKNTTGYRLCAFLDADEPAAILQRLVIGSEGTLAFIAEAGFETIPWGAHTATGIFLFAGVDEAAAPVRGLVDAGATAVELMVAPALLTASHMIPGTPESWRELPLEAAALIVEVRTGDAGELDALEAAALAAFDGHELLAPPSLSRDHVFTEMLWTVREGMHGLVGGMRPQGTALIAEDVCVPPARIAEFTKELRELLTSHGFLSGVAGHASAGNLHFLLTPNLGDSADVERYEALMRGLVDLVIDRYDGSLKAEHGTGRNMAPYVEREWGAQATELMWRVKRLVDPDCVLAPDIVLSTDPGIHLRDLRTTPSFEPGDGNVNACIECGLCEPVCPSRDLTTTPRQRIALRREIARQPAGSPLARALEEEYAYDGIETCAADGSCALVCPIAIDTGKLVKALRAQQREGTAAGDAPGSRTLRRSAAGRAGALAAARRWALVERAARGGLRLGGVAGDRPLRALTGVARALLGTDLVPSWEPPMPPPAPARMPSTVREGAVAVYVPACVNRIFGPPDGVLPLPDALVAVSQRAGAPVWIPGDVAGTCCGTPWSSKGFTDAHGAMARATAARLWEWSDHGALPVVIDAASCTHGVVSELGAALDEDARGRHSRIEVIDAVAWAQRLLPALSVGRRVGSVAIHPACASRHLGLDAALLEVARALADEAVVPVVATCCGMAGDRGFLHPELTASATAAEAAEVSGRHFDAHVCSNRTCEIALERATGRSYASIVQLLEQATRDERPDYPPLGG